MADTVKGSCLRGAVQFEVTLPTLGCCHRHCSMWRSGGPDRAPWVRVADDLPRFGGPTGVESLS